MRILKRGDVWIADCPFAEKDRAKAAGMRWHDPAKFDCRPGCEACAAKVWRNWWTADVAVAAKLAEFADSACRAELDGHAKFAADSLVGSRAADASVDVPVPDGLALLPFQRAGIAYMLARKDTLLADAMGLGKTIQVLGFVNASQEVKTVLVVCPATIRVNWRREAEKWLVREFKYHVVEKRSIPDDDATFVICNYDQLVGPSGAELRESLRGRAWDLLVVDESHLVKNPKAQRTSAILGKTSRVPAERVTGIAASAKRRLFLTGTPILNKPREIWPVLAEIEPKAFGNFFKFAKRFCDAHQESRGWGHTGWNFDGASNLGELQDILRARCMCRRLKEDVLTELPEKRRQVVEIPCDAKARKAVEAEAAAWAEKESRADAAKARMAEARANGDEAGYRDAVKELRDTVSVAFEEMAKLRHDVAVAKIPSVIAHVEDLVEAGEKVVVFVHHHDVTDALASKFGSSAVVLDGRTPMEERQRAVDRFQADETVRVFIGGIRAAGVGITLTSANVCVMGELDWVPANVTQAEDRLHRIGQKNCVLVQHLVLEGSLDARMAKVMLKKQRIADEALDLTERERQMREYDASNEDAVAVG